MNFYAVAWLCYLPACLQQTPWGRDLRWQSEKPAWLRLAIWGLLLAVCVPLLSVTEPWKLRVPDHQAPNLGAHVHYPVGAVDCLASTGFHGRLMVPFNWGAYVSWRLYPGVKVSVDSRYEVAYPPASVEENVAFYRAEKGWQGVPRRAPQRRRAGPQGIPLEPAGCPPPRGGGEPTATRPRTCTSRLDASCRRQYSTRPSSLEEVDGRLRAFRGIQDFGSLPRALQNTEVDSRSAPCFRLLVCKWDRQERLLS